MSIQLISVSHKTASIDIRSCFALTGEEQIQYMKQLIATDVILEVVVLSTCNRLEIYLYGEDEDKRKIFSEAETLLFKSLHLPKNIDGAEYLRFYEGTKAVQHLFNVACGLDSMVIGEDQILGQVKDGADQAKACGALGTYLNTCFRYAVTAAKKVKTETELSRIPVSAATIAVKAAKEYLGSLKDKNILIIGATGKIGTSVYKNLVSEGKGRIYMTVRQHGHLEAQGVYYEVPYNERYEHIEYMDVIISATSSPHYTLTLEKVKQSLVTPKPRVFIDLAVPQDIDQRVSLLPETGYYNIDDFAQVADENNQKKEKEAMAAVDILEEYRMQFEKWMVFQKHFPQVKQMITLIGQQAENKGLNKAMEQFFFALREGMAPEQLEIFMESLQKIEDVYEKN
ncbi:MAG: glutamyl-tRNA reductase [Clostridia bacterium]|nr:glutamyl-tRNA reductase [Lachnospiraceae bacterium]NCC00301.1 glutamyl-tRNA reductase [Clostridia bacterium]NCD02325.1 glutamyl-tRNA reductase [Clostridia bacterium]